MKTRIRSIIALILILCMSVSLFACDKNGGNDNDGNNNNGGKPTDNANQVKTKPVNVYKESVVTLGDNLQDMWSAVLAGDRIYYNYNSYDETTGVNYMELKSISITNPTDIKSHLKIENNNNQEENVYNYTNMNNFAIAPDGALWVNVQISHEDYKDPNNPINEYNTYLRRYDDSGTMTNEIKSSDILPDEQYAYFGPIRFSDKNMIVTCNSKVLVIDTATGVLTKTLTDGDSQFDQVLMLSGGKIGAMRYDYEKGGQLIKLIDPATLEWGDTISVGANTYFNWIMPGDNDYLLYYVAYDQGIRGLKADGSSAEIVNFLNSDLDGYNISNIMKLENGEFLLFTYDYESQNGGMKVSKLTKVPDGEVKESIMLTYACMYIDYNLKRKILSFNKSGGEYRIQVRDYSQYNTNDNYNAGRDRLNADIINGNIPDMMSLTDLDFRTYANKGILADLYELMDSSTAVQRSDYVQNVLKAAEYDGKLYRFIPEYTIQTTIGKKSIFGAKESWTLNDFEALLKTMPSSKLFGYMTRTDVLNSCLNQTVESYIDWNTGTCKFDEGFIKLLEFAKSYPETIDWDELYKDPNYYQEMERDYMENRVLLMQSYVSGYRAIRDYEYQFAEPVHFVGYPTPDGNGSVFYSYSQHGVSAMGKNKQVCFDFLASVVQTAPDFTNSNGYFYGSFSLSQAYMDAIREYEMTPLKQRPGYVEPDNGEGGGVIVYDRAMASSSMVKPMPEPGYGGNDDANYHLTAEEVQEIDNMLQSIKSFSSYNEAVMKIITEEADEFFAGRRSADETARIVQSRVQIYVSESM